jgi:hypothetical protein
VQTRSRRRVRREGKMRLNLAAKDNCGPVLAAVLIHDPESTLPRLFHVTPKMQKMEAIPCRRPRAMVDTALRSLQGGVSNLGGFIGGEC